jgi:transposase
VIALPTGTQVWLAAGVTDMRRGMHGLAATVQMVLLDNPHSGHVFVFRGRRGDRVSFCVLPSDTGQLQRPILAVFREVTWPARDYFPHTYPYSVGGERGSRDLPGR